jgi:acetolactate synthase-1/2/3 large subunit
MRIETAGELDDGIAAMLDTPGPVMVDCRVAKMANCFPMIPSGAAHTEMMLHASEVVGEATEEGQALV